MERDKRFRELIDRSFVEEVSEGERQLIQDHIRDCHGCKRYLELTARTIRGLREFTFTSEADSNVQVREILAHHTETMRQHIRDCHGCKRYLELTARTIRGLREFTFTSEADSNVQVREILAHRSEERRVG